MPNQPSPGEPALMSSTHHHPALSRQPVARVLQNMTDPRDKRGIRHCLPRGLVLGGGGVSEPNGDLGAYHRFEFL